MIRYGDGVGLYRTHLFGSPSIIACFPAVSKFIFQSNDIFILKWPSVDILGQNSLVVVQGEAHKRLRNHVTNAITRPDALCRIAVLVQPRLVAALQSWVDKRRINTYKEIKKVRSIFIERKN
jgi:ent-kaurenoic acid hydroxylase